ncbi:MAG TPA: acyltransferase family protein [Terracidiphilus sp.]
MLETGVEMVSVVVSDPTTHLSPPSSGSPRSGSKSGLKYRADIDGLRAVAVLSVLAFHIGLSRFHGGFVGVDVFFVISGYLISSIIFAEISGSRFTIIGFYERRIRRILPALFAVLAASSVAAAIYLLPGELVDYAKSMLAATGSASNIYFWWHSGYFDMPTSKPLLHTWSLAVEEQFYLSFPLFLILVRRFFSKRLTAAVVVMFLASFATSCAVVLRSPETAFYMPYTRAWELLLGTLLSLGIFPKLGSTVWRNLATMTGIGMVLWSVLFYSNDTLFPGFSALLPCIGSGLIIWSGEAGGSIVGSVLSWRPVVFIGLISYSLYLWHWPIIVLRKLGMFSGFARVCLGTLPAQISAHRFDMLFEVVLSLALAVLSWRFVEKPFRVGSLRLSGRPLFALAGGVMVVFLGCATWIVLAQGFPGRFPERALDVTKALDSHLELRSMRTGTCFITTEYHFEAYDISTCLHQVEGERNFLLLGDSHSAMLWSALAHGLKGANVMQASTAACEPSLSPAGSEDCKKMMAFIFHQYLPAHHIDCLLLAGRWEEGDLNSLTKLIAWAKQKGLQVVVFGPVPEYDAPLPRLLAYSIAWNKPAFASQHLIPGQKALDTEMQQIANRIWQVPYISLYDIICRDDSCTEFADPSHKLPLMGDDNHLSTPGAVFVVQRMDKAELD